jgi:hypothetical protein
VPKTLGDFPEVSAVCRRLSATSERSRQLAERSRRFPKGLGEPPKTLASRRKVSANRREFSASCREFLAAGIHQFWISLNLPSVAFGPHPRPPYALTLPTSKPVDRWERLRRRCRRVASGFNPRRAGGLVATVRPAVAPEGARTGDSGLSAPGFNPVETRGYAPAPPSGGCSYAKGVQTSGCPPDLRRSFSWDRRRPVGERRSPWRRGR